MAAGRGPARTGNEASPLAAGDRRRGRARCGFGAEGASGGGGRRLVRGTGGILPQESRLKSRVQDVGFRVFFVGLRSKIQNFKRMLWHLNGELNLDEIN